MTDWIEWRPDGIYLAPLGLWLDPRTTKPAAWVSHAHSDHACGLHAEVIATPATLDLYRIRWPEQAGTPQILTKLNTGEAVDYRGARLTAYAAGHIHGAAQLLIEYNGERLVYTGDIKLREPLCAKMAQVPECDTIIIESTFGLPIYRFLERDQAAARIVDFAQRCLASGETPIFLGYALGRGQEIAHVLGEAGIPTMLHGAIARLAPIYESLGTPIRSWRPYERGQTKGHALVWLPGNTRQLDLRQSRVAAVSGWAALHNARARYEADDLIPYSDHADFGELIEIVRRSRAHRVFTIHGYTAPFARLLAERLGVEAQPGHAPSQRSEDEEPA
jgi:Cft2 family RNA processing exonuclease